MMSRNQSTFDFLQEQKRRLAEMKTEYRILETSEPTAENLVRVKSLGEEARALQIAIRHIAKQHGMAV